MPHNRRLVPLLVLALTACATIMHGTEQGVGVSSQPTNAKVSVDNKPLGVTPVVATLARGNTHVVRVEMDGYQPFEMTLIKSTSGWVWGNIVFGGLIGLAVDAISGGLYNLEPAQVMAQMQRQGASGTVTPNGIYVVLVPEPRAEWLRLGTLRRATDAERSR